MNDREQCQLFLRAYDMTGYGLSDYLQDFFDDDRIRATQHGEKAYYEFTPRYTGDVFSAWSDWRYEISYYFDGFLAAWQEQFGSVDKEEFMETLVFKIARILGIFKNIPGDPVNIPEKEENFMFW